MSFGVLRFAPGYRYYPLGALSDMGYGGFIWSSITSDTYGLHLSFGTTWFFSSVADRRTYGLQLL